MNLRSKREYAARKLIDFYSWNNEHLQIHKIAEPNSDQGLLWYEVGEYAGLDSDLYLHINERHVHTNQVLFEVAAFALGRGVCVGWIPQIVEFCNWTIYNPVPGFGFEFFLERRHYEQPLVTSLKACNPHLIRNNWKEMRELGCPFQLSGEGPRFTFFESSNSNSLSQSGTVIGGFVVPIDLDDFLSSGTESE